MLRRSLDADAEQSNHAEFQLDASFFIEVHVNIHGKFRIDILRHNADLPSPRSCRPDFAPAFRKAHSLKDDLRENHIGNGNLAQLGLLCQCHIIPS